MCVRVLILFRVIHHVPGIEFGVGYSVCVRVLNVVSGNTFCAGNQFLFRVLILFLGIKLFWEIEAPLDLRP